VAVALSHPSSTSSVLSIRLGRGTGPRSRNRDDCSHLVVCLSGYAYQLMLYKCVFWHNSVSEFIFFSEI
jgi:hypothetical protein